MSAYFSKLFSRRYKKAPRRIGRPVRSAFSSHFEQLEDRSVPAVVTPDFVLHLPTAAAASGPTGLSPTEIRDAYAVNAAAFGSVVGDGTGQTIAIVDAYNQPDIASDLAAFDADYGLAAPASFKVVNESGGSTLPANAAQGGWGVEISLDVEWAHVIAPKASILLVEASSANDSDLYAAVDTARNYAGVSVVSMSWGEAETSADSADNTHFTTPSGHIPVTFIASSGDDGAYGAGTRTAVVEYPAASPNVVSVGGTTLTATSSGTYESETGWGNGTQSANYGGSGGGISQYTSQPSYQTGVVTQSSTARTVPDVSLDADPNSGVSVYDTYDDGTSNPWTQVGGTSLAAPMWAGIIAIADQGRVLAGKATLDGRNNTLPTLYSLSSADFHDITSGNNGYAAGAGYDLVTGRGTPIANLVISGLVGGSTTSPPTSPKASPTIGSFAVNPTSVVAGATVTLTASGVSETGGTISSVKFYRESNGTSGLQIGSDTLIGTGTQSGTTWTISTSTTGYSAGNYTYYAVATDASGVSTAASSATLIVTSPPVSPPPVTSPPTSPVAPIATTSTLTGTVVQLGFNLEQVTLTDTVTVAAGQAAPTGTVAFYWQGELLGEATLKTVNGITTATLTVDFEGNGWVYFTANYLGNSQDAGSVSNGVQGYI